MFTVHLISDLDLKFNEFTPLIEQNIPDVDLVVLNGNIATVPKRGMLYVEELCKKYPTTQFLYNQGMHELYTFGVVPKNKYGDEAINAARARSILNDNWPKNLHCFTGNAETIKLRNQETIDVYGTMGFPNILKYTGRWEDTFYYKNIITESTRDIDDPRITLPKNTSRVSHGDIPIWATQEWIRQRNNEEFEKVRKWELTYDENSGYKILLTHFNPISDTRCKGQVTDFFNIHLNNGLWLSSNTRIDNTMYLGAKFVSNPGRGEKARSLVVTIDTRK